MGVTVDRVRPADMQAWQALRQALYTGLDVAFHHEEMAQFLADSTKECFLARDDSDVVLGMAELSLRNVVDGCSTSPVGYLEGLFVNADTRGAGVGRLLVERAVAWCREQGCQEMGTDSELANEAAQRFHEHMGFTETYRVVQFKKTL